MLKQYKKGLVIVRGGGDLASGSILRLANAGYRVLILEAVHPAAIRRQVSFCDAVYEGSAVVEGKKAVLISDTKQADAVWERGEIPLLVDPCGTSVSVMKPDVVVDAILAKKNLGTTREMARVTCALGPGFTAGVDVDYVVETKRGHNLGRIYREGTAVQNTGIPGNIGGYTKERVMHSPVKGIFKGEATIGDLVEKGQVIAHVETEDGKQVPVITEIPGILRGILRDGYPVTKGFKLADVDPRKEELQNCFTVSDKARCIAGSVLEIVCAAIG